MTHLAANAARESQQGGERRALRHPWASFANLASPWFASYTVNAHLLLVGEIRQIAVAWEPDDLAALMVESSPPRRGTHELPEERLVDLPPLHALGVHPERHPGIVMPELAHHPPEVAADEEAQARERATERVRRDPVVIQLTGGFSLLAGNTYGRVIGIIAGSLGAIGALLSVGGNYPWWSLGVFALCVFVVHGIIVYGEEDRVAET